LQTGKNWSSSPEDNHQSGDARDLKKRKEKRDAGKERVRAIKEACTVFDRKRIVTEFWTGARRAMLL